MGYMDDPNWDPFIQQSGRKANSTEPVSSDPAHLSGFTEIQPPQPAAEIPDSTPPTIGATLRGIDETRQGVLGAGADARNATSSQANALMNRAGQSIFSAPSITGNSYGSPAAGAAQPVLSGIGRQPFTGSQLPARSGPQLVRAGSTAANGLASQFNLPAPPAFQVGQQLARPQLSAPPATIANRLGAAPAAGSAMEVAGRLGTAPGDVQLGNAPGAIAGQLGNMGAQNAGQQNFLSRIEGFLDQPEGPSVAEAQLRQAQADNMGNLLGAARSGRGGAGAQAQALRGAISEGAALSSDTAGQMATLRAQEADMRQGRNLQAMGLGSDLSTAQRSGDLSFRGQDLSALQGDQSTELGARGQDLGALQSNQATALGARGQDLSALQGDQSASTQMSDINARTALGARGQDLGALQSDQATQLGSRGQDLEGNIAYRGQDVQTRDQDRQALTDDANRQVANNDLNLRRELGLTDLGLEAQGQGLAYDQAMQGYGLGATGMAVDAATNAHNRAVQVSLGNAAINSQMVMQQNEINSRPSYLEQLGLSLAGNVPQAGGAALGGYLGGKGSDVRAKTDISLLDKLEAFADSPANDLVRKSPGYSYKYKDDASRSLGEDPDVEHWGPMAQDLEKSKVGRSLVSTGRDGIKRVDVGRLALTDHAALHSMRKELDAVRDILGPLSRFLGESAA